MKHSDLNGLSPEDFENVTNVTKGQFRLRVPASMTLKPQLLKDVGLEANLNSSRLHKIFDNYKRGGSRTILCVPSLSFPNEQLEGIYGIEHYETRSLWEILKASCPRTNIVFVCGQKISFQFIEHLISSSGVSDEVYSRIKLIEVEGGKDSTLSEKILSDPKIMSAIKDCINDGSTYLEVFNCSENEKKLSEILDIPLFANFSELSDFQTKSSNRTLFKSIDVPCSPGKENIVSIDELFFHLEDLCEKHKFCKFMIKLDHGVSGDGNAILQIKEGYEYFIGLGKKERRILIEKSFKNAYFQSSKMNPDLFQKRLKKGGVVEVFIDGGQKTSPSCQAVIYPDGNVKVYSTHEQILDESGMCYRGSLFPANQLYRKEITMQTLNIGLKLAEFGVIGPFSVDYLYVGDLDQLFAIEINLRKGGTTHPFQTTKYISSAHLCEETGFLKNSSKMDICYLSNDNYINPGLKTLELDFILDSFLKENLLYRAESGRGVVFHMLSAMKPLGKLGFTLIGDSCENLIEKEKLVIKLLDKISK